MSEIFTLTNLARLGEGLIVSLELSAISIAISIVGGVLLGVLMSLKNRVLFFTLKFCLELIRIMPTIVWLFIFYFGFARAFGLHLSAFGASVVVFSVWGVFEMMDIVRGALTSIPKHQFESAQAIGLNTAQIYRHIIVPQALRRITPSAVNLLSRIIKTTPIVVLIGVIEVVKIGQQIIERHVFTDNFAPFWVYAILFFLYFIICYPISKFSQILEQRWS